MTAGLPPVGELVQITFRQQADTAPITGLGYVEQIGDVCGWWCVWPPRATSGENCDLGWQVESWCRVLLLPDTAETWRAVATACTPLHIEAALREAAIR